MRLPALPLVPERRSKVRKPPGKLSWLWIPVRYCFAIVGLFYSVCWLGILALRVMDPPVTVVQIERRMEARLSHRPYHKRYEFVPLEDIAPNLKYAVIAEEDGRFYVHHGFDWITVRKLIEKDVARHRLGRGGSTITQQLVKNLFLGTERSVLRKGVEFTLVPVMELVVPKERILEVYLNVIEWGPGIYGAQSAAKYWYHVDAARLTRDQAARLAAIIPNPLRRTPAKEGEYSEEIQERMRQMGW